MNGCLKIMQTLDINMSKSQVMSSPRIILEMAAVLWCAGPYRHNSRAYTPCQRHVSEVLLHHARVCYVVRPPTMLDICWLKLWHDTLVQDNPASQVLDFITAKDDGGGDDHGSYKTCKTPVKSSPSTYQHPVFCRSDALPVTKPTVSKHRRESVNTMTNIVKL